MRKLLVYIILFIVAGTSISQAQQFPLTTQYLFNPYALTPERAGYYGHPAIYMNYRKDWTGINGSPKTFRINGFGNIYKEVMWLGGEIYTDKTDIISRFKANLSYSYILQVEDEQFLYFGVWTTFYQNTVRIDKLVGVDPNDPILKNQTKLNGTAANAGFGITYNWRDLNIGFAFPTLFDTKEKYVSTLNFKVQRESLFYVSDMFILNEKWQLQTYAVFRKTKNEPLTFELSVMPVYLNRFWGGLLYRNGGALAINVGGHIYKGFVFNYSYEIGMGGINSQSGGSHEITLGYRFNFDGNKFFDHNGNKKKHFGRTKNRNNFYGYPKIIDYRLK